MAEQTFPLPSFEDDEPVVMHDEFRQIVADSIGCFFAVGTLMALLRGDSPDLLDPRDRAGLAVLLESVHQRLELVVDGLRDTGSRLGVEGVPGLYPAL